MLPQKYCLRWKYHYSNVSSMFSQLLEKERFCDVTLYCCLSLSNHLQPYGDDKGVSLRAHRVVLAACSDLFSSLLSAHESLEPVLVIDAHPNDVRALVRYMYTGEMSVTHSQLPSLLKTAEELKIKGLTDIRWNNKDEPPDSKTGAVTTTAMRSDPPPAYRNAKDNMCTPIKTERDVDKFCSNGGPPPLIKLPSKERLSNEKPPLKRDITSDNDDASSESKRKRLTSGTDNTDDEDRDQAEWRHGNMDITAERVVQWCGEDDVWERDRDTEREEEEWGDAPADIGSFLHTRLQVDGDNSNDESNEAAPRSSCSSVSNMAIDLPFIKTEDMKVKTQILPPFLQQHSMKPCLGPKSGPTDPRFPDVVKLNDYLRHGRRPQFWEEDYVRRVMEAIRLKELEMKQAAEILGVSYGTLYGRYRDAYGCINRPFRTARDFWSTKGASEVLDRLKRGEIGMEVAATTLGVSVRELYVFYHELQLPEKEFEPIPIEIDPSLRMKTFSPGSKPPKKQEKPMKKLIAGMNEEDSQGNSWHQPTPSPNDPGPSTSPTLIMKSRPDLTIVAAKKMEIEPDT